MGSLLLRKEQQQCFSSEVENFTNWTLKAAKGLEIQEPLFDRNKF